jgi:hypothetical protein
LEGLGLDSVGIHPDAAWLRMPIRAGINPLR